MQKLFRSLSGQSAPPKFGRSVNPIQTRVTDFAPHTTASPPRFKKLSTPLQYTNDFK